MDNSLQSLMFHFQELEVELKALRKGEDDAPPRKVTDPPKLVQFQGKKVAPGVGYHAKTHQKLGILAAHPHEFIAVPHEKLGGWGPEDLIKIPRTQSAETGGFPSQRVQTPGVEIVNFPHHIDNSHKLDTNIHGHADYLHHDPVKKFFEGFDFGQDQRPATDGAGQDYNWWGKNAQGKHVFVKPVPREYSFSEGHAEALYHNLANNFFGLGQFLPKVALVHHPRTGQLHTLVEGIPGEHHQRALDHQQNLMKHGDSGAFDKMGMMNMIMGNIDRHSRNWMWDKDGTPKLIDHGITFALDQKHKILPDYLKKYHDFDPSAADKVHPEAAKWAQSLDPRELQFQMQRHSVSNDIIEKSMARLKMLQEYLKQNPNGNIKDALFSPQIGAETGMLPSAGSSGSVPASSASGSSRSEE